MAAPAQTYDSSRWTSHYAIVDGHGTPDEVRLHYLMCLPPPNAGPPRGTILLIHGFPQTSYQFRHVITPLADAGYRVLAPDYRGAGASSRPRGSYAKSVLAADLHALLERGARVDGPVHVVGHDMGGLVAWALAANFPDSVASLAWGETVLPGTAAHERSRGDPRAWSVAFHSVPDLPEALVAGRERLYLQHFYERLAATPGAIGPADLDHYAAQFAQFGALRAGFDLNRAFETDAKENARWLSENGKLRVPTLGLIGGASFMTQEAAEAVFGEVHDNVEVAQIEGAGHWLAEEKPEAFVKAVLTWVEKHSQ